MKFEEPKGFYRMFWATILLNFVLGISVLVGCIFVALKIIELFK